MKSLKLIAWILLIIGGLNWGLVGIANIDLVSDLLPGSIARIIFILVGLSALVAIFGMRRGCHKCGDKRMPSSNSMGQ